MLFCFLSTRAVFTQPRTLDSLSLASSSSSSAAAAASNTGAPLLRADSRVFMVGCGNSPFSADMYDAGFTDIANVDYAPTVIEQVRAPGIFLASRLAREKSFSFVIIR
jgi:hypothetical protein